MNNLYENKCEPISFTTGTLGVVNILLEHEKSFNSNFDKGTQARFILTGKYLAGLVLSNAFKSENVYKIILPRLQISYFNIKELNEDNITIYSRIFSFSLGFGVPPCSPDLNMITNDEFRIKLSEP